jgi:Cu+-exporting ATPase
MSAERVELPVTGMRCANCVGRVERALRAVEGVEEAVVNLAVQSASVRFDPRRVAADELADAIEAAGYQVPVRPGQAESAASRSAALAAAEAKEARALRRDFAVAAVLSLPVLVLGMSHGALPLDAELSRVLSFVLTSGVVLGPGRRFVRLAAEALGRRTSDMNTLVALGVLSAYGYSTLALFAPGLLAHSEHAAPHVYFEAAAAIITFVLLGKLLEARARRRVGEAVRGLMALVPAVAHRVLAAGEEDVAVELLRVGERVRVRPGERVPVDGTVVEGSSAVDESMLTGESMPIDKSPGSALFGGTLNQSGALTVRITRTGAHTTVARIVEAVEQAQGSRAPIARLADVVSSYFVPAVLGLALLTLVTWLLVDGSSQGIAVALERFVAVLVIACPCALGLATPAAVAVATGRGAQLGVLIKGGAVLEELSRVRSVLLDKTGTLTAGQPALGEVIAQGPLTRDELLELVAAAETPSEHPIARALVRGARERGLAPASAERFASLPGGGASARIGQREVRVGTASFLRASGIDATPLESEASALAGRGHTPVFVAVDGALAGLVTVVDPPTPAAREAVAKLRGMGLELAVLSGDRAATVALVAGELGITRVHGELTPRAKALAVQAERERAHAVAMVGDGINDAPALSAASVGIAIGGGTDIAIAAADVALLRGGIASLPVAIALARRTLRSIRENLFWAFAYNVIGLPLAAGVFVPVTGWQLSPLFASAAMSLSSVSVLLNSLRLRRFRA